MSWPALLPAAVPVVLPLLRLLRLEFQPEWKLLQLLVGLLCCLLRQPLTHAPSLRSGEPPVGGATGRGEVSSTYGQYDLCGFPKAAAQWYRTQWLLTIADGPDKVHNVNILAVYS